MTVLQVLLTLQGLALLALTLGIVSIAPVDWRRRMARRRR
jgi:hypothetical protein